MKKILILLGLSLAIGMVMAVPARAGVSIELGYGGINIGKPYYGKRYYQPKYRHNSYRRQYGRHQHPGTVYSRPWNRYGSYSSHRQHARPLRDRYYRYDDDRRYYDRDKRRDKPRWRRHKRDRDDDYRRERHDD